MGITYVPCICGMAECVGTGRVAVAEAEDRCFRPSVVLEYLTQESRESVAVIEAGEYVLVVAHGKEWCVCPTCFRVGGAEVLCRLPAGCRFSSILYEEARRTETAEVRRRIRSQARTGGARR